MSKQKVKPPYRIVLEDLLKFKKGKYPRGAQVKLAKAIGAKPQLVSTWMRGTAVNGVPYRYAVLIAEIYQINHARLCRGQG
ncbi:MAG: hypothetical protein JRC86_10100 [Deltaproteobacteria bacterium]|nr:hypothetical protein [Deltaproteobacteria bacterium]